jgi:hypothetical protein
MFSLVYNVCVGFLVFEKKKITIKNNTKWAPPSETLSEVLMSPFHLTYFELFDVTLNMPI